MRICNKDKTMRMCEIVSSADIERVKRQQQIAKQQTKNAKLAAAQLKIRKAQQQQQQLLKQKV
jgi:hypothetical protein